LEAIVRCKSVVSDFIVVVDLHIHDVISWRKSWLDRTIHPDPAVQVSSQDCHKIRQVLLPPSEGRTSVYDATSIHRVLLDTVPKQTQLRVQLSQHPKIDIKCIKQANKVDWSAKTNNQMSALFLLWVPTSMK
jgi:hypothetical protein